MKTRGPQSEKDRSQGQTARLRPVRIRTNHVEDSVVTKYRRSQVWVM